MYVVTGVPLTAVNLLDVSACCEQFYYHTRGFFFVLCFCCHLVCEERTGEK